MHQRQAQGLGLSPIAGDVVQVLGIVAELGEDRPGGFAGTQVLFGDRLALAGADQSLLTEDASDGAHAGSQLELDLEPTGAEVGEFAGRHDLVFDIGEVLWGQVWGA